MSTIETDATAILNDDASTDRITDLREDLDAIDAVQSTDLHEDRAPPVLSVTLSVANIPSAVDDLLDAYGATIEGAEVTPSNGLRLDLRTPERFLPAGVRDMREYGPSSVSITLTSESLELSGFDADTTVDVRAREGGILLTQYRP